MLTLAALAVAAVIASCVPNEPAGEATGPSEGIQPLHLGAVLEGGRTYRLPGSGWLIDVPEGMRLYYSFHHGSADTPAGVLYGLRDLETGSFIGIHQHTGKVQREAFGETPTEIETAQARLDRIEAAFRRLP